MNAVSNWYWKHVDGDGSEYELLSANAPMKVKADDWQGSFTVYRNLTTGQVYITDANRWLVRFKRSRPVPTGQNHE